MFVDGTNDLTLKVYGFSVGNYFFDYMELFKLRILQIFKYNELTFNFKVINCTGL